MAFGARLFRGWISGPPLLEILRRLRMSYQTLSYLDKDLSYQIPEPSAGDHPGMSVSSTLESKLDIVLQSEWNRAVQNGFCRYKLDHLESKQLDGKFKFLCQMNEKRATERRPPDSMTNVVMDFNHKGFHFNKVKSEEILLCIRPSWSDGVEEHFILINASPFEFGGSLLVPYMKDCYSQVLKSDGLRLAIETILLSNNLLRAGFNGLTAMASVNHFHIHLYYLKYNLHIETARVKKLYNDCHVFVDYPAKGFVFEVTKPEDIQKKTKSVMKLVNYFLKKSIPHNAFLTRGSKFGDENDGNYSALRICIWAREPMIGAKSTEVFVPACIELAGHIPLKSKDLFHSLTENDVIAELESTCNKKFTEVKEDIECIYLDD